jgi:hypothetical protein
MAEEKITPEEKLLKIIENPAVEKIKLKPADSKSAAASAPPFATFLRGIIDASSKEMLKHASLQTANKALAVICACLTISAFYNYLAFNKQLKRKYEKITSDVSVYKPAGQKNTMSEANLEDLIAGYRLRNIFSFIIPGYISSPAAQKNVSHLASNLKLVGVIWSDNPQAMVEDTQGGKTYLVSPGDYIGQMKVNKITRNSVIVGKDKEEWELR